MPEPSTTEGRRIQGELKNLLEDVAVRRAESSTSQRQGYPREHRAATSRFMQEASVHTGRTRDATPAAPGCLGNEHHRRDRRAHLDEKVRRGYHPRHGGRYDSGEDRSPSPEPPGPQAFSRAIRRRRSRPGFEPRLPSPSTQGKQGQNYGLWTTGWPASWVERAMTTSSSVTSPCSSPTPPGLAGASASCADLQLGRPGQSLRWKLPRHIRVPWELLGTPKLPPVARRIPARLHPAIFEAAHRAAQHHRLRCHRCVPRRITDSDVIDAFLAGTTCRDLVSKLGRKTPTRASELMDIDTKFASGQEAVEAIFRKDKPPQGHQQEDIPEASAQRGTKKKAKKKSQAKRDAADADLVAATEHRNPRKPSGGANLFDKMLKESCPYHQGPVKHTLEECVMLWRYFHKARPWAEGGRGHDNGKKEGNKAEEFPEVHDYFMIYGGQVVNASARHHKQECREVCSMKVAAPVYLDWSDKPITFDQGDHPDRVPSLGKYPLIVDPVICNVRLTKVLIDGGSSLNIIYVETLGLLQIDLSMIRSGAAPFHGIIPGKRFQPLGQLDLPVCFGTPSNFRKQTLTFEVVGF
jgi:hypothetical protein